MFYFCRTGGERTREADVVPADADAQHRRIRFGLGWVAWKVRFIDYLYIPSVYPSSLRSKDEIQSSE